MLNPALRNGRFTSSEIVALTRQQEVTTKTKTKGDWLEKAITYIAQTNMERMLGRSVDRESNAEPLAH